MEARDGAIRLHSEGWAKAETGDLKPESGSPEGEFRLPRFEGDTLGVPQLLPYPANLFVIGTVNVDETTYMFSPKVLDRAHVIEFEVDPEDLGKFLEDPKPLQPVPTRGGWAGGGVSRAQPAGEGCQGAAATRVATDREDGREQASARSAGNPAKWPLRIRLPHGERGCGVSQGVLRTGCG